MKKAGAGRICDCVTRQWILTRRQFGKLAFQAGAALTFLLKGCGWAGKKQPDITCGASPSRAGNNEYDYIVVGSGAGGGPLAANLARLGHRVLLLEAGGDVANDHYQVPVFHPKASEDPQMRWDFFVRHYQNQRMARLDPKFYPSHNGVYYPRCGTLGGCTAHNAMIFIYPHNSDWDKIAALTGDESWNSKNMRRYFQRLERCGYVPETAANPSRHGYRGWLPASIPGKEVLRQLAFSALRDKQLRNGILKPVIQTLRPDITSPWQFLTAALRDLKQPEKTDPNDWRHVFNHREGLTLMPLTTENGRRAGPREYIKAVQAACGDRLTVQLHSLVSRVLLDGENNASGVEVWRGRKLYQADRIARQPREPEAIQTFQARREVILAGGAFNTPQLLLLSGIGPRRELERHGLPVKVDLPGVGENLQDRYEVSVVTEMKEDFSFLKDAEFNNSDRYYRQWRQGKGLYTTNGSLISFSKRSSEGLTDPDLFIFGMAGDFRGYYLDYSKDAVARKNIFSWVILKAHTRNRGGTVRLTSADPRTPPEINFHYFDEGTDRESRDLAAVVEGIRFVRAITRRASNHIQREVIPGGKVRSREEIEAFVKAHAWGHHASCSCKMGPASDPIAVVDSRFRVHGVNNLRIVDASVFPEIPGFFIVSAIYMIAEKATDVIHNEALKYGISV